MRLEPIVNYIADNTQLTKAVDLFIHSMPADVKAGVLVVTETTGNYVDHEVKGAYKGRYQIIVRDSDHLASEARAYEMFELLNIINEDTTDYLIVYSRPRNTPIPIGGRSKGDMIEFSINFDFRYHAKNDFLW